MIPTPMMAASLLFKLHRHRSQPEYNVDPSLFKEVFMSKYGKVSSGTGSLLYTAL
jgi:hypothetical protein